MPARLRRLPDDGASGSVVGEGSIMAGGDDGASAEPGLDAASLEVIRAELVEDRDRLQSEVAAIERDIAGIVADSGDGSGDDLIDAGTKAFEREHEMSIVDVARGSLEQTERALRRIDLGTYGRCENCGAQIGIERLRAFPRATLCLACKTAEERS